MFDPLLEDDPFGENRVSWWRSLTTQEKTASVAVVMLFVMSGLAWPVMFAVGQQVLVWLGLLSGVAFLMATGLASFKVLGLLTGADDIRGKNLLWWEMLLLIAMSNSFIATMTILSEA